MLAEGKLVESLRKVAAGELQIGFGATGEAPQPRRRVSLTPREREIVVERRLKDEPATLEELSHKYAVSRERIRQIEVRAVEKLQKAVVAANASRPMDRIAA